jgi:hypothetical protein
MNIQLDSSAHSYFPGETITGTINWENSNYTKGEIRLFWYTSGKGTRDVCIVDTFKASNSNNSSQQKFSLQLPNQPYSFSGKLISLEWSIELVIEGQSIYKMDLAVSPTKSEILLKSETKREEPKNFRNKVIASLKWNDR